MSDFLTSDDDSMSFHIVQKPNKKQLQLCQQPGREQLTCWYEKFWWYLCMAVLLVSVYHMQCIRNLQEQVDALSNDLQTLRARRSAPRETRCVSLIDDSFMNNTIRAQIQSLIRDKNLDPKAKPDYASELNNAIMLDASSTYDGKKVSLNTVLVLA